MQAIVEGIIQIAKVSSYKKKYNHLKNKLEKLGLVNNRGEFLGKNDIKVVYIQPCPTGKDECIDFKELSNWLKRNYQNNEFEIEFADRLLEWSED